MVGLSALWIPILLSAVIVFVASSVIHMALPWHKNDFRRVPDQDKLMDALRPFALPPGQYAVPMPTSTAQMNAPTWAETVKKGPNVMLHVRPNEQVLMARSLALWFVYCAVVGLFAGYVTGRAIGPGAAYPVVFRFVGATAFLGYSMAVWPLLIWYQRPLIVTLKETIDGLLYALLTAGTFGWLWPR